MATSNYYLYDSNAKKATLIILRFRYNSTLLAYSTRQKIHPKNWNSKKKRAKETKSFPQHLELNKLLNVLEDEVFDLYRSAISQDLSVSNDYLKQGLNKFLKIDLTPDKQAIHKPLSFYEYLDLFIEESKSGIRLQKNGNSFRHKTIQGYSVLREHLINFSQKKKFKIELKPITNLSTVELNKLKSYWKDFYIQFTSYLYDDINNFDNAVGSKIKNLRVFWNYLNEEKGLNIGDFHKSFYVTKEDIPIIVLEPDQLKYLIFDQDLEAQLPNRLKRVKDIFVFGCTVALRVSDLLSLTEENLSITGNDFYLQVKSVKTNQSSSLKLPQYAIDIVNKYRNEFSTLLPTISDVKLNEYLKELGRFCNWNKPIQKVRYKRGKAVIIYKNANSKEHFSFSDLLTTHCMRRTAITIMLRLGLPERIVKEISGHSPNSSSFHKYVEISQSYVDEKYGDVIHKLKNTH